VAVLLGAGVLPAGQALSALIPPAVSGAVSGSTRYLPALLALAVCGGLLAARRHPAGRAFLLAAGVFVVSLTFRSIDARLCEAVPIGTHFLWHLLNGALLGWLLLTMVRYGRHPGKAPYGPQRH
jgi:hypothetical protein